MPPHTVTAQPRSARVMADRAMRASHDPFRARGRPLRVPQVAADAEPDPARRLVVVAVVDRYPPRQNAGAEWMLHHLLRDTAARGHRAIVATQTREPYVLEGVEVVPRRSIPAAVDAADVLVGHLLWTREVVTLASKGRRPLVYLSHNDHQLAHWEVGPPNVTVLVSNSEWVADRDGAWTGPHAVVRPPVLTDDYRLDRDPAGEAFHTLVNVYPEKGSDTFYALAARCPGRRFLAVEGAYGNQRRPTRREANVEWQPQTATIRDDAYARTRVLLVPSVYESWGRVGTEAMASGIPVVAHPTPGLLESLGDAGIFVDRDDVDGWMAALDRLDDPAEYGAASARALARAAELDGVTAADFDTWDRVLRLAATAREGHMTYDHNPFRAPAQQAPTGDPAASTPDEGPGDGDGVGGPVVTSQPAPHDTPATGDETPRYSADDVPEKAGEAVAWIDAAEDEDDRQLRAEVAQDVELARDEGDRRKTVLAKIADVLGT